jgi:Fic family protein
MIKIDKNTQKILQLLIKQDFLSSSQIHNELQKMGENVSLVTIKRELSQMVINNLLIAKGAGRSHGYIIGNRGRIFANVNVQSYCAVEPDKRYGMERFNFELFSELPSEIFSEQELGLLQNATNEYDRRTKDLPVAIQKKELERLIIELSWKSSKIEGNTYTLLDTEKLILENKEAFGHDKKESVMILNHKDAFNFVRENINNFKTLNKINLEQLHSILTKDLSVGVGFRKNAVGVTGSKYRPIDNIYQLNEAMEILNSAISKMRTPYEKSLMALLGISYIQPFEDGNKRTARLMANALLMAYNCAPLSYRSVDENDYRESMLVFYELNSIIPLKNIFISQYEFAAKNYTAK